MCSLWVIIILPISCLLMSLDEIIARNITTDEEALFAFKAHITNDPHNLIYIASNWSKNTSVCDWVGITCGTRHHRVTGIQLRNMSLTGTIPPHIGNLSFLANFSLSTNNFHGSLPNQLANLRRLKWFDLGYNIFNGIIPSWIGSFTQLQYLNLYSNNFGGGIPTSLYNLSKLNHLDLGMNNLEGQIPKAIANLQSLKKIYLDANKLSGDLQSGFGNLTMLQELYLSFNNFKGEIPKSIENLVNLEVLYIRRNSISGKIPSWIGNLTRLRSIDFEENMFKGRIPLEMGNLQYLEKLYLGFNNLDGTIPFELGNLQYLEELDLGINNIDGTIPPSIFNSSTLKVLSLTMNHLSGSLPPSFGLHLPNLERIYFAGNNFHGHIPIYLSNASKLIDIDMASNMFSGSIPVSLGNLKNLQHLHLWNNSLSCQSLSTLFSTLANCINLTKLELGDNPLNAALPISIGNLSSSLEDLDIMGSGLTGTIPNEIGNLNSLISLSLRNNNLEGFIPKTIGTLRMLQGIDLSSNRMQGTIPSELCTLHSLSILYLQENELFGKIPSCLDNLKYVRKLYLASNKLNSTIPSTLWRLKDVLELNLSSNSLSGHLSLDIGNLKAVTLLDLSGNNLSGNIPSTFGGLQSIINLSLSNNRLGGPIPESFGEVISFEFIDLSINNLSGEIPKSLEKLKNLMNFNVSFNELQGEIPNGGPFMNLLAQSFLGNKALCGAPKFLVHPCKTTNRNQSKQAKIVLVVIGTTSLALGTLIVILIWYCKRKTRLSTYPTNSLPLATWQRISIHELNRATNKFDEVNLLGKGSFGSVYKGTLFDGMFIAVKVFNSDSQRAIKSFDVECEVLCTIRHRNLVKIITSCCTIEFKALVMEFMPNWSLEKWLYFHNYFLDTLQRLNIMIDVASALEYIHHGTAELIVHCDLKPSNILLDEDMIAHVSDFGIAKLIGDDQSFIQTMTLATVGYMAPEYGSEGLVSVKGDMYSFGILLMETFTRKRPTDKMFNEELSIKQWIKDLLPSGVAQLADSNLIRVNEQHYLAKTHCISSIMELALMCCADVPEERKSSKEVVSTLNKIKVKFLNDVQHA